jgi:hypothetical protein
MPDEIFAPGFGSPLAASCLRRLHMCAWLGGWPAGGGILAHLTWLAATAICALVAAAAQGPSSPDERILPRPFTSRSEAALLASILAPPALGLATLSVRR